MGVGTGLGIVPPVWVICWRILCCWRPSVVNRTLVDVFRLLGFIAGILRLGKRCLCAVVFVGCDVTWLVALAGSDPIAVSWSGRCSIGMGDWGDVSL